MKKNVVRVMLGACAIVVSLIAGSHSSANQLNLQGRAIIATLNAQITALSGSLSRPDSRGETARAEVARLAEERFQFLAYMAENDPNGVFDLALPDAVLTKIPSNLNNLFEKRNDIEGELEVIEECDGTHHKTLYNVRQNGKSISLKFSEEPKQDLRTGSKVRVKGIQVGDTLDLGGSTTATNFAVTSAALANTTGDHKVAVILVNFQDNQSQPFTVAQAQDVTFNTTSNYYRENSYGQTSLSGDVFGWFTMPVSSTSCDINVIGSYAQQAAIKAGANLSAYNHIVYAFPHTNACTFSGRSSVGGNPSQSWVNADYFGIEVVGHELGHAFGLSHSRSLDCRPAIIDGTCTVNEYGDAFDIMGASMPVHFNAYQKERLGWLNSGGSPPIQTVTASGTYRVDAYETAGSGAKGLKILKSTDPVTGYKTWYYIEKRTNTGFDSYLSPYNPQNGVLVHKGSEGDGQEIYLLDMIPSTNSFYDAALITGQSFTDSTAGVTIATVSADSTGAWVQVTVGSQPCTHANPSVSVSPGQSQWLKSGTTFTYSVTITNNESGGCSAGNFNLQDSVPAGWSASYSASALSIAPGASSTASFYVTSSAGAPDGMYNVNAAAVNGSNSSYSSSASAAYSIVSSLGVTAASGASTYTRTQKASVTAVVSAGGFAVSGAPVTFTLTKPNGSVFTQTATTGSNGSAVFAYAFNKRKDPLGTYQVKAVSNANGLTGQGTTSFLVNK